MAAETKTLHFDISHKHPRINYKLRAGLKEYPLTQHTDQTHSLAVQSKPGLNFVPRPRMSHFATDVVLPSDVPLLWQVTAPSKVPGAELDSLVLAGIHIPDPARRKVLERRLSSGRRRPVPMHLKFVAPDVSLDPGDLESHLHVYDWNSAVQAACTLTF